MDWLSARKAIPECLRSVARFTYLCGLVHINGVVINGVNSINELRAGARTPRESIVAYRCPHQEVTCHKTGARCRHLQNPIHATSGSGARASVQYVVEFEFYSFLDNVA